MIDGIFDTTTDTAIPVLGLTPDGLQEWCDSQSAAVSAWVAAAGFRADAGTLCLVPGDGGGLAQVLFGTEATGDLWGWAGLPSRLPEGVYRVEAATDPGAAALGWALGSYRFGRYKAKEPAALPRLAWPEGCDRGRVERLASAAFLVRDLINTPANAMGPAELAAAASKVAEEGGGAFTEIVGDALLDAGYPAIHAVGRASPRQPRLLDIRWGDPAAPRVTLVGKGVCFDTGGLDIKPVAGMKWMKKDMGGAAHVLGLGAAVMAAGLPVRLRILIPAVENSVSGEAMRPHDVIETRKGLTAEVANTDAEGRLVLADALTEAASENPELILDWATLTGAARVALGPDLPALFANDDTLAGDLLRSGEAAGDPVWRLPLFKPYRKMIDGKVADLSNAPDSPYAGAITAALFLQEFVDEGVPWAHLDVMAWNTDSKPGRPEGGEAMGLRAAYAMIEERFAG